MYKPTIGLEIHAELRTKTKMFCNSKNDSDETRPNVNICPICMAHPGTLPVINKEAVKHVLKVGIALGGDLADYAEFDRKNYFYPDLPKGYQISQYQHPLVRGGLLNGVAITRVHLEEDTGRLVHSAPCPNGKRIKTNDERILVQHSIKFGSNSGVSCVDFNRAGIPLMELVTEPVIENAKQAGDFARELQLLLRYLGASEANMEKGEMRVEANISVTRSNEKLISTNGTRIILKERSYRLMGLLFKVHNELGTTYKEKNYQDAIAAVLKKQNIPFEREKPFGVMMDGEKVSDFYADFLIDGNILLEVKAKKEGISGEDIRQVLRYVKSAGITLGIIVNFRKQQLEYKRIINPAFESHSSVFDDNSSTKLGTKVEVKNLNSFRSVERAIDYEVKRQIAVLEKGERVAQETRGWDEIKQSTFSQRMKEESHDYRYFPDPDLPSLKISEIAEFSASRLKEEIPELPWEKRNRYIQKFGVKEEDASFLVRSNALSEFFEDVISSFREDKKLVQKTSNYITSDLTGLLGDDVGRVPFRAEHFAALMTMIKDEEISSRGAKDILAEMLVKDTDPRALAEEKELIQKSDVQELKATVLKVIEDNPRVADDYKSGKESSLQYLVGQAMKETKGSANPQILQKLFKKLL